MQQGLLSARGRTHPMSEDCNGNYLALSSALALVQTVLY